MIGGLLEKRIPVRRKNQPFPSCPHDRRVPRFVRHVSLDEAAVVPRADHLSSQVVHVGLRRRSVRAEYGLADLDQCLRVLQLRDPLLHGGGVAGKCQVPGKETLEDLGVDHRQAQAVYLGDLAVQVRHDGPAERVQGVRKPLPCHPGGVVIDHERERNEHAHQENGDGKEDGSPDRAASVYHAEMIARNLFHVHAQSSPFTAPGGSPDTDVDEYAFRRHP